MGCGASKVDAVLDIIEGTPFAARLEPATLHSFARLFKLERYGAGEVITDVVAAPAMFVLGSGKVEVVFEETVLCTKARGEFFGQLVTNSASIMERKESLHRLHQKTDMDGDGSKPRVVGHSQLTKRDSLIETERLSTVRAAAPVTVAVVHADQLQGWLKAQPRRVQEMVATTMGSGTIKNLEALPFFRDVPESKIRVLSSMLHYVPLRIGEVLFEEGSVGDSLYIVYQGSCRAVARTRYQGRETRGEVILNTFSEGDFFGEISLIVGMPRTATIEATEDSLLLELRKDDFKNFLKIAPDLHFTDLMKRRFANHFRKYNVPFFASIPDAKYPLLASLCKVEQFDEGAVIFSEGEVGSTFYIIAHGEVRVTTTHRGSVSGRVAPGTQVELSVMGPGKYFGEIALIRDTMRTATVTTVTRAVILSITKEKFQQFFREAPEALADFEVKLARYDVALRSVIYHPLGLGYFRKYLEREHALENIDFWQAARDFRHAAAPGSAKDSVLDLAAIFKAQNAYIVPSAAPAPAPSSSSAAAAAAAADSEADAADESPPELLRMAKDIYDRYISTSATEEVNVSGEVRARILADIERRRVTASTFVAAERDVVAMLERDSFSRFKQSELFSEFLRKAESYDERAQPQLAPLQSVDTHLRSGSVVEDSRSVPSAAAGSGAGAAAAADEAGSPVAAAGAAGSPDAPHRGDEDGDDDDDPVDVTLQIRAMDAHVMQL